jgi:alpha-ketoglutarate-dependent taurine dioxygenase
MSKNTEEVRASESTPEDDDLQRRLRVANERKARFEEARQSSALARKVAEAEREAADLEVLEGLIEKHGELGDRIEALHTSEGMVVVKRPNSLHFRRFQELGNAKLADVEKLVRASLVYPDATRFDAIVDALPATLIQAADLVAKLAGVGRGHVEGK